MWVLSWFCRTCLYPNDLLQIPQVNTFSRPLDPLRPRPLVPGGERVAVPGCLASEPVVEPRPRWRLK